MLQNNNRKFMKCLSVNCFRANRQRNLIAVFAIVLTAMLFTSVFTIWQGSVYSIKEYLLQQAGSRAMVTISGLSPQARDRIVVNQAFDQTGTMVLLGRVKNVQLQKLTTQVILPDQVFCQMNYMELAEGRRAVREDEVTVDTVVLDLLGLPHKAGVRFPLQFETGGRHYTRTVTVSGFWEGAKEETSSYICVSKAFKQNLTEQQSLTVTGILQSQTHLDSQLDDIIAFAGFNPKAEPGEKGYVHHSTSPVYSSISETTPEVIAALASAIMIILLAGYLIIYNVFYISVVKDIRLYGQLKTVGVTHRQIGYIVRKQALWLTALGIPIGLLLGWLLGNGILPLVMKSFVGKTAYFVAFNWKIMLASTLFTVVAVQISCRKPSRIAGRVSPVQAMKYNGAKVNQRDRKKGGTSAHRIVQMAVAGIMENRWKSILVIISIALSIILMNGVLNLTLSFDRATYQQGSGKADFIVSSVDLDKFYSKNYMLPEEFLQLIKNQQGIHNVAQVFYHHNSDNHDNDIEKEDAIIKTRNGDPYGDEYDYGGKQVYSFDENALMQCKVVSGHVDWKKFQSGRYVIEAAPLMDNGNDFPEDGFTLQPGDKITVDFQGTGKTYEVMANVACHSSMLYGDSWGDLGNLVLSKGEFQALYPEENRPIKFIVNADKGSFSTVEKALSNYKNRFQSGIAVQSKTTLEENFKSLRRTYNSIGLAIGGTIGVIGLLNLLNVILTGAIARQRQFAVMQSIGMTGRQLRKLLVLEGVLYTGIGGIVGVFFSGVVSLTIIRPMSEAMWFGAYRFSIVWACMIAVIYFLFGVVISIVINRLCSRDSIAERLRKR